MDREMDETKIIDWTDRKDAMDTYRKYEELNMTGPNYLYYNGKLQPAPEPMILRPENVSYKVEHEKEGGNFINP